jgi:C-terminal processing protease CtpA/Prc
MQLWKTAALGGAFVIAITGPVVTSGESTIGSAPSPKSAAQGQSRERAPLVKAFEFIGGGAQIGVTVRDIESDDSKQPSGGVIVDEVQADSPAVRAGFKAGDAIVEFDGERVRSVRQFKRLVEETPVGRKVPAVLLRNGQRVTVSVMPERSSGLWSGDDFGIERWDDGARSWAYRTPPAPPAPPRAPRPPAVAIPSIPDFDFGMFGRGGHLGLSVETLTPQLEEYFGVKEGVLVRSVAEGSAAAKAGLKAGDIITAVNGSHVNDPSDLTRAINRLDDGDEFTLEIVRDKKAQTLKGKIEARRARGRTRTV